jgi:N-acyl-D-amino-acid deacylase
VTDDGTRQGDVLVRGGVVVDGTGAPPVAADVRVRGGVVVEVGAELDAADERVLDVDGAYVAPGSIEAHTHYDGAMWWDPGCDPLPAYGTTTVVMGNCGLTVAPLSEATRDSIVDLFCFIEDLPLHAFRHAVPWTWQTWPEYRAAVAAHPAAVNVGVFVGHQSLRTFVMGDDAWERPATATERGRLAEILDEALTAGALGFSTTVMDTDRDNREVPSRLADDAELGALLDVVARHPGATFQVVPRFMQAEHFDADLDRFVALCRRRGVRMQWGALRCEADLVGEREERWARNQALRADGADVAPLLNHMPSHVNLHFDRSIMWHGVLAWHELVNGPHDAKPGLLADPGWRARARAEWDACTYTLAPIKRPDALVLDHSEHGHVDQTGVSLDAQAASRGVHASDALADWLLANGLRSSLRTRFRPLDEDAVVALVRDPATVTGGSDAGAHIQMFSGAGNATYLFTRYVRDLGALRIEEAVHAVTGKHARFFGLTDRGTIAPRQAADLCVFALDELDVRPEVRVDDIPGGSWRYTRPPAGYRATIVGGVPTWLDGAATGARPGTFVAAGLRS